MSEAGIAVALCYLPDEERTLHTEFRTDSDHPHENPMLAAKALKKSCQDDFPGSLWAITGNERAKEIMVDARLAALGIGGDDE